MKITRVAKYVGTTICLESYLHRWISPRNKFVKVCRKINESSKSTVGRLVEFKIFASSVLRLFGLHSRT